MNKPKKILHIVPDLGYGGVEKIILNCYGQLNYDNYFFDFVTHGTVEDYHQRLIENGSKIYYFKTIRQLGLKKYADQIRNGLDVAKYDVIHIHTGHLTGLYAIAFKKAGAPKIICHAHTTKCVNPKHSLFRPVFRWMSNHYSDYNLACGVMAGNFCFGKGNFEFLPNGIDYDSFKNVDAQQVQNLKKELGLEDCPFIIGHIAHFSEQKNHPFVIKLACEYAKSHPSAKFVLVGDGPDREKIENLARECGADKNVIFVGTRKDIPIFMKTFDAFILPSLYEGLPVVSIEAQCSGTPCLLSDQIDKTLDIGAVKVEFLELNENCENWVSALETIQNNSGNTPSSVIDDAVNKSGYDIKSAARKLGEIYQGLLE